MRNTGIEYPAVRTIRVKELGEPPALESTQVLLETVHSGITNGTERHALLGEHFWQNTFPSCHGYQHVARIAAAGDAVKDFSVGDMVFCGQYVGHRGWHVVDVASAAASSYGSHLVIKLPEDVPLKECALLGVAGVAMRGVRRCRVAPAQNVWVAGQGLIGQFTAQSARAVGAHVTVTDVNEDRLERALRCGAHRAIDMREAGAWEELKAGGPYDCIFDCCGVNSLLLDIHQHTLLGYRGVIGLLAVRVETTFNWGTFHTREASMEVSCHFSLEELKILLHFIREGIIEVAPLITHNVPIDEAIGVYELLRDRPGDLLGVVFDW
ncbi:MAG TPA: zinc-binding alcohol dehydrogenase [Candidatus Hydrogenedentes bacterium]|nr:zinc-binding alcohol dehydrogenase [Candidatus Hydrogenedentota bacterium]